MRKHCVFGTSGFDCGPAALTTVVRYFGLNVSLQRVTAIVESDILGTSLDHLAKAAQVLGFETRIGIAKPDVLTSMPLPAILRVQEPPLGHYVVLYEMSSRSVLIADPNRGLRRMRFDAFLKEWEPRLILFLQPGETFTPAKDTVQSFRYLVLLLMNHRLSGSITLLFALITTTLGFAVPYFVKLLIDRIIPSRNIHLLGLLSISILALMVGRAFSSFLRQHVLDVLGRSLELNVVSQYVRALLQLPIRFFSTHLAGDLFNRFYDAGIVRQSLTSSVLSLMVDIFFLLGSSLFIIHYGLLLTLVTFLWVPPMLLVSIAVSRSSMAHQRANQFAQSKAMSAIVDVLMNIRTVKATAAEDSAFQRISDAFIATQTQAATRDRYSNTVSALSGLLTSTCSVVLLWVGSYFVISGTLSVGRMMFFSATLGIILSVLDRLVPSFIACNSAIASFERISEVLQEPSETVGARAVETDVLSGNELSLKDITFEHRRGHSVLKDISLSVRTGELTAIVGETGCGKSTLAQIMAGLDLPDRGALLVGDVPIETLEKRSLRKHIGIVFQDAGIFGSTIAENISMGDPAISMEDVVKAAEIAMAASFISKLPYQYDSPVGSYGLTLSSGQRQRIAIARAIARKPKILILDEATSNLDPETEEQLLKGLSAAESPRTIVLITHRLTTVKAADNIIVMSEGRVVESGCHEALLRNHGKYASMWAAFMRNKAEDAFSAVDP
jgi:ABC-type bacteriocin/lantibiotic exporter with double-glycine peptidase domain